MAAEVTDRTKNSEKPDSQSPNVDVDLRNRHDSDLALRKPSVINPQKDTNDQKNLAYNPLSPIGLTEGTPGKNLDKITGGVMDRTVTTGTDGKSEHITGELDDSGLSLIHNHIMKPDGSGLDWNTSQTKFTTDDKFAPDGKLATRVTTYDRGVSMNFATQDANKPVHIDGVTRVETNYDQKKGDYETLVTGGDGKVHHFLSDQNGTVKDYHPERTVTDPRQSIVPGETTHLQMNVDGKTRDVYVQCPGKL